MRLLFLLPVLALIATACSDNSGNAAKTFCDTTCSNDTFKFDNDHELKPYVRISVKNCVADSITWSHSALLNDRQMHMGTLLGGLVRLHKDAMTCFIKDTSYAWVSFNDCITGRGYLMYLPYNKEQTVRKMSSAINSFDKKFVVPDNLRAYCDYSTIYVEDIHTGAKEQMTFKEEYDIDFNNIHKTVDSVNISNSRIFVQLIKDGQKVALEKSISL